MSFFIDKFKSFFDLSSTERTQAPQQPQMAKVEAQEVSDPYATISEKSISKRINDFGLEWYQETIKKKEGNALVSPMSAFVALSMAYLGAKGHTAEEMKKVLTSLKIY